MDINWITVFAQVVNFLVLVALLRRFLYRPVLEAMDRRQATIRNHLAEADERRRTADRDAEHLAEERRALAKKRDELLADAAEAAEREKRRWLETARMEVAETRASWRLQVEQEKEEFLRNLRHRSVDAVQTLMGRVLRQLADADLQAQVVSTFIRRLEPLDETTRHALTTTSEPMRIRSAFPLAPADRQRLTQAVHEHLGDNIEVRYADAPELGCGIELIGGGARLSWNLESHLEHLRSALEAPARQWS